MTITVTESVIIFGETGNVVMVLDGEIPKDSPVSFAVGEQELRLVSGEDVIYVERGLNDYLCERLKSQSEIGIMEIPDQANPPLHLTNVAYQAAL